MARVMLVDGYPSVRKLYALHLTFFGLEVENIETFTDAFVRLKLDDQWDAIFANVNFYDEAGLRFIETAARAYPHIPVVAILQVTIWDNTELRVLRLGARACLIGPILRSDFVDVLKELKLYPAANA